MWALFEDISETRKDSIGLDEAISDSENSAGPASLTF